MPAVQACILGAEARVIHNVELQSVHGEGRDMACNGCEITYISPRIRDAGIAIESSGVHT